jgi:hypothetical protein
MLTSPATAEGGEERGRIESERLMSVREVKDYLGLGIARTYQLFHEGLFPVYRISGRLRVRKTDLGSR